MRSEQVHIESPCHESWEAMDGDAERRFCGVCQKHVHNLSAMRMDEADALVAGAAGSHLCVRYSAESDGTLRFRDLVPRAALTRKVLRTAFAASMLAACTPHGDGPKIDDLGDAVIESIRQDTVPTADGGCDYHSGPFTTFHLPPGHVLCRPAGDEVADPPRPVVVPPPPPPLMGAAPMPVVPPPPPPPDIDPIARPKMGEAVAIPDGQPFEPCDPKPGYAPPPPPAPPGPGFAPPPPPPEEFPELQGDIAYEPPPTPPPPPRKTMGTISPRREPAETMGQMERPVD